MKSETFDDLVLGSGLAGLTYALRAAEQGSVAVLTKADVRESNTSYAQGGIAAAVGEADSWRLHEEDTLIAGAGLCDPQAVRFLVQKAPEAIAWLQSIGAQFDGLNGILSLGREGGHSRNRIVHHRDRTGWEIERAVSDAVRAHPRIKVLEHAFATRLLAENGRCVGAEAWIEGLGVRRYEAKATMLATGGCGRLYQHTTNPRVATADGIGLAHGLGARIENMEFMQFHPTTLYHPQSRSFLITEAVRGAGATLRNHLGRRFMYDYDPRLELAPRDIVSRSIDAEMKCLDTWCVYLDATHLEAEALREEFPTVYERLLSIGIAMERDWIPVVPAQHYSCGGVKTDLAGRTSVPGLFAAGEVASTGVHGANRLASNSLLEALVFAQAAAEEASSPGEVAGASSLTPAEPPHAVAESDSIQIRRSLEHLLTEHAGIVRNDAGLHYARDVVQELMETYRGLPAAPISVHPLETYNLLVTATYLIEGALARRENVGLHYNEDLAPAGQSSISE